MVDNTTLNTGAGGDVIATDDIGGVKFQRVKIIVGADGTNDGDIASANPLPISGPVSLTGSGSVALSGPVSLSSSYTVAAIKAALPAGTNAIGKLAANSGVDIGDVDVTSIIPGVGATNLGKAIDTAAGATDTGIAPVAIRDDALSALTPIEGDWVPLRVNSTGALHTTGQVSITGSSSVVVSSGAVTVSGVVSLTGSMTVLAVGAAAHDAAVAGAPVLTGFEARTTNPTAVANGDAVRAMADDMGRQVVMPVAPRDLITDNHNGSLTLSTTLTLLAAGGASVFRDLLAITLSNPTATDALVTIFDGLTAGTERFRWELAANGGGLVMVFNTPFKQASANNGWGITSSEVGVSFTAQAVDTV